MTATVKRLTLGLGAGLLALRPSQAPWPTLRIRIRILTGRSGGEARVGLMGQAGSAGRADRWACCRGWGARSV